MAQLPDDLSMNLVELRAQSLKAIAFLVAAIGYSWLFWVAWPITGGIAPPPVLWAGPIALMAAAVASYALRKRSQNVASGVLVCGMLVATGMAGFASRSPAPAYLFVVPIIFASVLFSQPGLFLVGAASILLSLTTGPSRIGTDFQLGDLVPAIGVCVLATLACWLSAHNVHTALAWVWRGYERARRNEELARERQAELRRALKALDEATHRLERANYMLTLARNQAEDARRLKQQFAQTISHELRTPLNLVVGFTQLMTQSPEHYGGQLPAAYARDLSIVHRNARHLQSLVDDVLDLARIEAAQMTLLLEETDVGSLVDEAIETARSLVAARGLDLHAEIERDLPRLRLDPTRIRQVLFNLLNNAARFTDHGSVSVRVRRQGSHVLFSVADTGVGIPPGAIDRIFEEFQQADGSTRRRHGGAGLGLAISRRFVELHGGRIWVESQVGQGSTFSFSLPVEAREPEVPLDAPWVEPRHSPQLAKGDETVLLAVTRSPSAAALLTRYVQGCRTVVVPDLEEARRAAQRVLPQAVLVDWSCREMDGASLEGLAHDWGLPRTPFVACPLPGEQRLRERLAVDGYLIKPVSREGLWDALRRFGRDVDSVLVIDDDQDFLLLLTRMLDSPIRRYRVVTACTGREGLDMMRQHHPDLVLLDLVLPDMHGSEVIEHLRAMPGGRDVPILVVSAQEEIDQEETLAGNVVIGRASGLRPGEVVRWVQSVVDLAAGITSPRAQPTS